MWHKFLLTCFMFSASNFCSANSGDHDFIMKRNSNFDQNSSTNFAMEPPANNINSIQYLLYTPEQPFNVCYLELDESNVCEFNASYEMKVLIHGFTVKLLPGNLFEQIKNTLLEYDPYNVIVVNWTTYNKKPYKVAVENAYLVGMLVGKMINFVVSNKGVNPLDVHIIGHSLGAHVAGVAGKQVFNLGRVTGLDPAAPSYSKKVTYNRLTFNSANFVDVMHTSNDSSGIGYGFSDPIGSIDFYPNGGTKQPSCYIGGKYQNADAALKSIKTALDLTSCNHDIALVYFISSIHACYYISVECENYQTYSEGKCNYYTNPTDRMGLYSEMIPNLHVESKFYLNTDVNPPYCEVNWEMKIM